MNRFQLAQPTPSFEQLFAPEWARDKPSARIRDLARADLQRALASSNRDLDRTYGIPSALLKTPADLDALARDTEESMYVSLDADAYTETLATFLAFLADPRLARDALLFRLLVNTQVTDLFLEPNVERLLFGELVFADASPAHKTRVWDQLLPQISDRAMRLRTAYLGGQNVPQLDPLTYTIPRALKNAMNAYRDDQIDRFVESMYLEHEDDLSDEEFESEESEEEFGIDALFEKPDDAPGVEELFAPEEESDGLSEGSDTYFFDLFKEPQEQPASEDAPSDAITCDQCKTGRFTHTYRTPVGKKQFKHFCSMKCMEQWTAPRKAS